MIRVEQKESTLIIFEACILVCCQGGMSDDTGYSNFVFRASSFDTSIVTGKLLKH